MSGAIFRRIPLIECLPKKLEPNLENIARSRTDFEAFALGRTQRENGIGERRIPSCWQFPVRPRKMMRPAPSDRYRFSDRPKHLTAALVQQITYWIEPF